jgi:glutathione S-transferase
MTSRDMQQRATRFLVEFAEALESSEGPYLIGDRFSAADLYWAYFSNLLAPMDDQRNPMVPAARSSYEIPGQHLAGLRARSFSASRLYVRTSFAVSIRFLKASEWG